MEIGVTKKQHHVGIFRDPPPTLLRHVILIEQTSKMGQVSKIRVGAPSVRTTSKFIIFLWLACLSYNHLFLCRSECSSHGGTLASIHSQEENYFLSSLVRPHGQFGALTFIGATKVKGNSTVFEWDDGTAWDFENWEPG